MLDLGGIADRFRVAHATDPNIRPMADGLSQRERQIVDMATNGLTDQAIANRLGISRATVTTYWSRIRTKFGPLGRTELVANYVQELADNSAEELAASELLFRSFCECAPIGIYLLDRDLRCSYVNPAWSGMSGLTSDQSKGEGWQKAVHPEDLPVALGQREASSIDVPRLRLLRPDGQITWVRVRRVQRRVKDVFDGYVGILEDISSEVAASLVKEETEGKYRALVQAIPELVWLASADKRFLEVNDWAEGYLGMKSDDLLGRGWMAALHPDDLFPSLREWRAAQMEKRPYEAKIRLRRHDGEYRWNVSRAVPSLDSSGDIRFWTGVTMDVHDHRHSESVAAEIVDRWPDFICIQDTDGTVHFTSSSCQGVLGCSEEELKSDTMATIARRMQPADFEELQRQLPRLAELADGGMIEEEFQWVRANGEQRWLRIRTTPYARDGEQAVTQVLSVIEDVSDAHALKERADYRLKLATSRAADSSSRLAAALDSERGRQRDLSEIAAALECLQPSGEIDIGFPTWDKSERIMQCARFLGRQPCRSPIDVASCARLAWEQIGGKNPRACLETPESIPLEGDAEMVAFLLHILIDEALTAMHNLRAPQLVVEPLPSSPGFVVEDSRLSYPDVCDAPHASFGLEHYTAHRIVEFHGGTLTRSKVPGGGCLTLVQIGARDGVREILDLVDP